MVMQMTIKYNPRQELRSHSTARRLQYLSHLCFKIVFTDRVVQRFYLMKQVKKRANAGQP